jgi:hypothetical protein
LRAFFSLREEQKADKQIEKWIAEIISTLAD